MHAIGIRTEREVLWLHNRPTTEPAGTGTFPYHSQLGSPPGSALRTRTYANRPPGAFASYRDSTYIPTDNYTDKSITIKTASPLDAYQLEERAGRQRSLSASHTTQLLPLESHSVWRDAYCPPCLYCGYCPKLEYPYCVAGAACEYLYEGYCPDCPYCCSEYPGWLY